MPVDRRQPPIRSGPSVGGLGGERQRRTGSARSGGASVDAFDDGRRMSCRYTAPVTDLPDTTPVNEAEAAPPPASAGPRAFLLLVIAALIVLWLARTVIGPFIVAAFLSYAFSPLVSAGERRLHWPRIAIVALGYLVALAALGVVGYLLAGQAIAEFQALS